MTDTPPKPSFVRRALRRTLAVGATALVFIIAGGLVVGGSGMLAERADAVVGPDPAPIPSVSAMRITPQDELTVTRSFQGQVEPAQTVSLAFQQPGEIETLVVDEGDHVQAGQVIATLDTRILDAERARLEASRRAVLAQVELAELINGRQAELRERGFASQQQLDSARLSLADLEARIAEIDAGLTRVDVQMSQTQLVAPFDGVIASRFADEGTVASVGQAVVEVLQDSAPIFRVGIDPALADEAVLQTATITLGGQTYDATFDGFRPDLDRQTRTRTALFELQTDDPVYLQAGTITLAPTLQADGYLVPLTALQDGVRGLWTVLALTPDEQDDTFTVGMEAMVVLHLESGSAYVAGTLSGETLIIADGAHRFVPGERVRVLDDPAGEGAN